MSKDMECGILTEDFGMMIHGTKTSTTNGTIPHGTPIQFEGPGFCCCCCSGSSLDFDEE